MQRRKFLGAATGSALLPAAGIASTARASAPLHLVTTYIAGTADTTAAERAPGLRPGQVLALRRAADSPFDPRTIEVWDGADKLGALPGTDARILARLMDAGSKLEATVRSVALRPEKPDVRLDLYLVAGPSIA